MSVQSLRGAGPVMAGLLLAGLSLYPGAAYPLPRMGLAALFLFCVVQQDLARARIPNAVTLPAFAAALAGSAVAEGWSGLGWSLLGAAVVSAIVVIPFALRGLGGGDVKALLVIGALWGPGSAVAVLWWSAVVGGVVAALVLAARAASRAVALEVRSERLGLSAGCRNRTSTHPLAGTANGLRFGAVLALAVPALRCWGTPW